MWQWFKYYRIPVMLPSNMFDMVLQDIHSVASLYSCKCDINNIIHVTRFFFLICTFPSCTLKKISLCLFKLNLQW